jgi:misacylated tRNA(Ala) deacylase
MSEEALYLKDSYMRECDSKVISVKDGKHVVLDQTVFYPRSGGQPCDTGKLIRGEEIFNVVFAGKVDGRISHEIDRPGLAPEDKVRCVINWERRYTLMRYHTAAHIIASVVNKRTGALITGNQLETEKTRFDFSLENFDRNMLTEFVKEANDILKMDIEVKTYSLPREEAMKIPGIVKLAGALPPDISILRIVEMPGIDIQADGGTHVKNLQEVGEMEIIECTNKGKENRRVYFRLK